MRRENHKYTPLLDRLTPLLFTFPWLDILAELWKISRQLWRGMSDEGIYEVLAHEAVLELKDKHGKNAQVYKRQKVRYLQNNIITYQDQAWGDGDILLDYCCSPGHVVDRWRPGQKTQILISLRESKRRGEVDDYRIQWGIYNGFVRNQELWETEVSHKTRQLKLSVIFPKSRPPFRVWLVQELSRKRKILGDAYQIHLSDGRRQVTWETNHPRLNERYQLAWEW